MLPRSNHVPPEQPHTVPLGAVGRGATYEFARFPQKLYEIKKIVVDGGEGEGTAVELKKFVPWERDLFEYAAD